MEAVALWRRGAARPLEAGVDGGGGDTDGVVALGYTWAGPAVWGNELVRTICTRELANPALLLALCSLTGQSLRC